MLPDESFNANVFDYYPALNKVQKHIEINYSQAISLSDAAEIAGYETKHFGKFFRRKVRIGFKQWLTMLRIRRAMELICKEHQPLTDIAFTVGFEDFTTFERAFKKHTGLTPRQFRKRIVEQLDVRDCEDNPAA
jgi:transcriptional regulator GlxA family with amidase domain